MFTTVLHWFNFSYLGIKVVLQSVLLCIFVGYWKNPPKQHFYPDNVQCIFRLSAGG